MREPWNRLKNRSSNILRIVCFVKILIWKEFDMESDKIHYLKTDLIMGKFLTDRMKLHTESSYERMGRMIT